MYTPEIARKHSTKSGVIWGAFVAHDAPTGVKPVGKCAYCAEFRDVADRPAITQKRRQSTTSGAVLGYSAFELFNNAVDAPAAVVLLGCDIKAKLLLQSPGQCPSHGVCLLVQRLDH